MKEVFDVKSSVAERVTDYLNAIGINAGFKTTLSFMLVLFRAAYWHNTRNMFKGLLKCNKEGIMGNVYTPDGGGIREWLRVNGLNPSIEDMTIVRRWLKQEWRSSWLPGVSMGEDPRFAEVNPALAIIVVNQAILAAADIAKEHNMTKISISWGKPREYDATSVCVEVLDDDIHVIF